MVTLVQLVLIIIAWKICCLVLIIIAWRSAVRYIMIYLTGIQSGIGCHTLPYPSMISLQRTESGLHYLIDSSAAYLPDSKGNV
jgi:hypothetical protein